MKVSSTPVISVITKLHHIVIYKDIFSLNMGEESMLVISVIIKLQHREIFRDIFGLAMFEIQFLINQFNIPINLIIKILT